MKVVAITACPTGIAHTYMAAEKLESIGRQLGHDVKVETQGAIGIENELSNRDILAADVVLLAVDIAIEGEERFEDKRVVRVPIQKVLKDAAAVFALL
ncbi:MULTISPECIES: PTS fructose transporter subunit IIB [Chromobacteriaceae]|uniref:protein-N(pi)-phosphohistidine--D-fructose phosphotransferase n=3 Tax=Chromobacteriaceae TaxID=1499392 RepID=A0ABV0H3I6_9NEIS|nr:MULTISPECIES: PTS fructose transporter subunit IIB [Chromobacteriaceae]MBX9299156.1 PTS fructose transporter subunit IIB [Chromobacterium vaccinii]ERE07230.1 PTS fructose transporter subunit IIBC [Pseudogulbenkiania ferrooxidans EGD-HP2]MBX9348800.1 PTS fructose transporter subunit IIB [Chromobacterium vaccinii]MBX9359230.1 PTS fructose transporter subunit IIB [Chromobacterium vaccinii]NHQ81589.1 PTS fructose transporter subunit IIB [Chromobacterium vaccinii]